MTHDALQQSIGRAPAIDFDLVLEEKAAACSRTPSSTSKAARSSD